MPASKPYSRPKLPSKVLTHKSAADMREAEARLEMVKEERRIAKPLLAKFIKSEGIADKLRRSRELLHKQGFQLGEREVISKFCDFISDRIMVQGVIDPMDFLVLITGSLNSLRCGFDIYSNKRVNNPLANKVRKSPETYKLLRINIPLIAEATCPALFAKEVSRIFEEKEEQKMNIK